MFANFQIHTLANFKVTGLGIWRDAEYKCSSLQGLATTKCSNWEEIFDTGSASHLMRNGSALWGEVTTSENNVIISIVSGQHGRDPRVSGPCSLRSGHGPPFSNVWSTDLEASEQMTALWFCAASIFFPLPVIKSRENQLRTHETLANLFGISTVH